MTVPSEASAENPQADDAPRSPLSERTKGYGGGLLVAGFGALAIWEGLRHPSGTLTAMGPGFLPVAVGIVLLALAAAIALESHFVRQTSDGETALPSVRAALAIFGALLAFAFIVGRYGVVPATFALVLVSAFAQPRPRLLTALAVATALSVIAVAVFIQGFGLSMRAFRW